MAKRRKVTYRKKQQNRMSMFLVTLVVVMIIIVVSINSISLRAKAKIQEESISKLDTQISQEEKRTEELEEFRKYTQTKKYAEEVAKEKLGLVYEGEIIFNEED